MGDFVQSLVEQYGLLAVFVGCFFEGESAAILGGFFAHQGIFDPTLTFVIASVGSFLGDGVFFFLGRRFSGHHYVARARKAPGFSHAMKVLNTYPDIFVITNRYMYGLRIAGGIAVGLSRISTTRFLVLNAIGALIWAGLFCGIGFFFGLGFERLLGEALRSHNRLLVGLIIAIVALITVAVVGHQFVKRRTARAAACADGD
ncbi:MAG: DedA family protein [Rhizobiaceae bacterium]|nr:DedA family protein [Rhizobiaceae bacterium]